MKEDINLRHVTSTDGTNIGVRTIGEGPDLVLVHGAGSTMQRWDLIIPVLAGHYQLHLVDRRGRGRSGDAVTYSIQQEFDDIACVIDSCSGPASVLGHSYGGICALEASLRTDKINHLILYEPPLSPAAAAEASVELADAIETAVNDGDRDEAQSIFFRDVLHMSNTDIVRQRRSKDWDERMKIVHLLPRELRSVNRYRFIPDRFQDQNFPVSLFLGELSPQSFWDATAMLEGSLKKTSRVMIPGQKHLAMATSPEVFSQLVLEALKSKSGEC